MSNLAVDLDTYREKISDASTLREIIETKQYYAIPAPILEYLPKSGISPSAQIIYLTLIFPRAVFNKKYFAKFTFLDAEAITGKAYSTVRKFIAELEEARLIERTYTVIEQKNILTGARLTFPAEIAREIILTAKNRHTRKVHEVSPTLSEVERELTAIKAEIAAIEAETPSPTNNEPCGQIGEKILSEKGFGLCPPLKYELEITNNLDNVININNTPYSDQKKISRDKIMNVVFNRIQITNLRHKLANLGYPGSAGIKLIKEMAFSLNSGTWKIHRNAAIKTMLQLIEKNEWRTPYYFGNESRSKGS